MNTSYFRLQNKIINLHHGLLAQAVDIFERSRVAQYTN